MLVQPFCVINFREESISVHETLSCVILTDGQIYFKNFVVFTRQDFKVCLPIFQYKYERNLSTMHPAKISFKLLKDTTLISLKGICYGI